MSDDKKDDPIFGDDDNLFSSIPPTKQAVVGSGGKVDEEQNGVGDSSVAPGLC